jgi:uncharacterized membrane protein YphA (DoxX/SURF4 family)
VKRPGWIESIVLLFPLRMAVSALFFFSAWMKLKPAPEGGVGGPQVFVGSLAAYKIVPDHLVPLATFVVPWTEVIAALFIFLGLWARSAGLVLSVMMLSFIAAVISVIQRGLDIKCACFGDFKILCDGAVDWCKVGENAIFLAAVAIIAWRGAGKLGMDALLAAGKKPESAA